MKRAIIAAAALAAACCLRAGEPVSESASSDVAPVLVTVGEGDGAKTYDLATAEGAQEYVDAYAENVQSDKDFKAHEAAALATIHAERRFYGTWWAILPPLIAILIALVTKEGLCCRLPSFSRSRRFSDSNCS